MSNQVTITAEPRPEKGKGAAKRLRKTGRVPAIIYGHDVDPTPVSVDNLELYHAFHTPAGTNVMLNIDVAGTDHLCIARDLQRHPVRGDYVHVDLVAVDRTQQIHVEVPVHLTGEEDADAAGVINHVLWTVPILVRPLDVPNYLELSVAGMTIGDVKRVEDLRGQLPEGAEFDIDPERTIVTINAPDIVEEPETDETLAAEDVVAGPDDEGVPADASEVPEASEPTAGGGGG